MLLVTLLASVAMAPQMPQGMTSYSLVLFKSTGKYVSPKSKKGQEMAAGQYENLQRLATNHDMVFSASLDDRNFRGLAVLKNSNPEEAAAEFENDPFVKAGIFKVVATKWWTMQNAFKPVVAPVEYEQAYFGILWSGKNAKPVSKEDGEKLQAGHMANINRMADFGLLKIAGPFENGGEMRGVLIFQSTDKGRIEREVAKDAAVNAGRLDLRLYKMKIGKGTIG
jgi:uncharacterized protein YciI